MIWRAKLLARAVLALIVGLPFLGADAPATRQAERTDQGVPRPQVKGWMETHNKYVELAKKGNIDLYFVGDSITNNWHSRGKEVWAKEFAGWNAGNFGIGGDHTQHVLWRLDNGELDGVRPKVFVVMIGTNNHGDSVPDIVAGVTAVVEKLKAKEPEAKILLLGIFPRGASADDPLRVKLGEVNKQIASLEDGKRVKYMDIGQVFLEADGTLTKQMAPDLLHPAAEGYQRWADAIKPTLMEWLGPPKTAATTP